MTFIALAPFSVSMYKVKYMQRHVPICQEKQVTAFDSNDTYLEEKIEKAQSLS